MDIKINTENEFTGLSSCPFERLLAVKDTINVLFGKWRLSIIAALLFDIKRFTDIKKTIPNITSRMLSKELKELEQHGVVKRTVHNTTPVLIEYELTESGKSIKELLEYSIEWGLKHRKSVLQK